jgi:hypothetical protein
VPLQVVEVRDATAADHPETMLASADQRVMVMTAVVRNGLHSNFIDLIRYSLADKDDVAYVIEDQFSSASFFRRRPRRRPLGSDRAVG